MDSRGVLLSSKLFIQSIDWTRVYSVDWNRTVGEEVAIILLISVCDVSRLFKKHLKTDTNPFRKFLFMKQ